MSNIAMVWNYSTYCMWINDELCCFFFIYLTFLLSLVYSLQFLKRVFSKNIHWCPMLNMWMVGIWPLQFPLINRIKRPWCSSNQHGPFVVYLGTTMHPYMRMCLVVQLSAVLLGPSCSTRHSDMHDCSVVTLLHIFVNIVIVSKTTFLVNMEDRSC